VLQTLVHLTLSRFTNQQVHATALLTLLYRPIMQFWFLYALFLIFIVFGALVRARAGCGAVLAVALGLYVIAQVATLGPWGVPYSVANNMIYFAVGVAVADHIHSWVATLTRGAAALGGLFAFAGLSGAVAAGAADTAWGKPVVALTGIVGTVALTALVRGGGASLLRGWGERSLQIYVAHTIAAAAVRIGLQRGAGVTDPLVHLASGVAVGLYAPVWLDAACTRVGFRYAFTWPRRTAATRRAPT
jgi:peptidoglycan/LPS O-acetylase OafA/YrhL